MDAVFSPSFKDPKTAPPVRHPVFNKRHRAKAGLEGKFGKGDNYRDNQFADYGGFRVKPSIR